MIYNAMDSYHHTLRMCTEGEPIMNEENKLWIVVLLHMLCMLFIDHNYSTYLLLLFN